jgi:glutamate racemase
VQMKDLAIGVFDSGVGGLTVMRELVRALPAEDLLYLGDTARLPYGSKSGDTVLRYSRKAAGFLVARGAKALVIACNTASAYALPALGDELDIPVVGVIEPGAEAAVRASSAGQIGVIATAGTVSSGAYTRAIKRRLPDAVVVAQACPLLVPLAEEGWVSGEVPKLVAERYFAPFARVRPPLDTLVLGCTHYPLLEDILREEIARAVGGPVSVVSSGRATARALIDELSSRGLLRPSGKDAPPGARRFFVTDDNPRFAEVGARFMGEPTALEWVDLGG